MTKNCVTFHYLYNPCRFMNNLRQHKATLQRYLLENTSLGHRDAQALIDRFQYRVLQEKDIFQEAGMPVKSIGFLSEGVLARYTVNNKGQATICQFVNEQRFFADVTGFYNNTVSGSTIKALTRCHLLTFPVDELYELRENDPVLMPIITEICTRNLVEIVKMQELFRCGTVTGHYQELMTRYPRLIKQVQLQYIASYLNITQQSLSRIRKLKH